jgi:hypothetical protein
MCVLCVLVGMKALGLFCGCLVCGLALSLLVSALSPCFCLVSQPLSLSFSLNGFVNEMCRRVCVHTCVGPCVCLRVRVFICKNVLDIIWI